MASHVLRLDALTDAPAGVYFIRLAQSGERRTTRGVLLRVR